MKEHVCTRTEAQPEKENPYTAKDLISALDAAGVRRAAALSEAYLLGTRFVHVPNEVGSGRPGK